MFDIVATDCAERDLTEIRDYLLYKVCNPQAWKNLLVKIRAAYQTLQRQPYAFVKCNDPRLQRKGYRKCSFGSYLFIYRVDESHNLIHIVRYFHSLQDYEGQLQHPQPILGD